MFAALISGLPDIGRGSFVASATKPGFAPVIVPVHSVGVLVAPVVVQLLLPATRRVPPTQVISPVIARITFGAPAPFTTITLLCISTLSISSKSRQIALAPGTVMIVLFTKR